MLVCVVVIPLLQKNNTKTSAWIDLLNFDVKLDSILQISVLQSISVLQISLFYILFKELLEIIYRKNFRLRTFKNLVFENILK